MFWESIREQNRWKRIWLHGAYVQVGGIIVGNYCEVFTVSQVYG